MNILIVTRERPAGEDERGNGNSARISQITTGLSAGHELTMACLNPDSTGNDAENFRNADELQPLILSRAPDVILVSHWELVALLPFDLAIPVVLDLHTTLAQQELLASREKAAANIRSLRNALGRCDLIVVGNEDQKQLLIFSVIEAGLDTTEENPVIVVPPGSDHDGETQNLLAPLFEWLKQPGRANRVELPATPHDAPTALGVPPLRERIARQWKLIRHFVLPPLLGLGRTSNTEPGHGVIIVTRGDLFPPDHGAAVRTLETAHGLVRQGWRVGLVTDKRNHWHEITADGMHQHRVPWRIRFLSLPSPLTRMLHHSKDIPHSNSFLYLPMSDGSFFWRILAANKKIGASVLQAEFPAYAKPCLDAAKALACGVVLVEHNVEYQRMKEQVAELTSGEFENLRAIELDLCRRSDAVVCVSDNDRRQLIGDGIEANRLHTIPHGVDLSGSEDPPESGVRERFGISDDALLLVYHGTFSYPPNREVLGIFANTILPGLEKMGIEAHVLAIGRDTPPSPPHERIHFTGSVLTVGPWLRVGDIAVVPLTDGGGTRMKILDYFAARLPVISTRKGIEGIPASHGREALIIDEWPALIEAIAGLWKDSEKSSELAANGRNFAESLGWDEIARRYVRLFGSLDR